MSFLSFGGFVAGILGFGTSSSDSYVKTQDNFDSINRTLDRIAAKDVKIKEHQKRLRVLESLINRIERMECQRHTKDFQDLAYEIPHFEEKFLDELANLRYQARKLLDQRYI